MAFITEWNQTVGNFTLPLRSGYTYNFDVDFGDGSAPVHVAAYNDVNATHNYTTAGTYQISITGTCGAWYINNSAATKLKLTKVIDWGNVGFTGAGLQYAFYGCSNLTQLPAGSITGANNCTNFTSTFYNCINLTSIPANLFDNNTLIGTNGFQTTFQGCTGLTSIPVDLFRYNTGNKSFDSTFYGCTGLTSIPVDLFKYNNAATLVFSSTFYGCIGLTSIPVDLFRYNTSATTFQSVFRSCTGLTSIPVDLFRYNILNIDFSSAFQGCTGLTSMPVDLFRYNTLVQGFSSCFYGCTNLTILPADIFRYNTGVGWFDNCFYGCTNLTTLPADIFRYNTAATTFYQSFMGCSNLEFIPVDLFRYNTAVTTFNRTFYNCNKLILNSSIFYAEGEQSTRFLNKTISFQECFYRASSTSLTTGNAPDIWNCNYGTKTPTKTNCFNGVGNSKTSLTNYCFIASGWGAAFCQRFESIGHSRNSVNTDKISITTSTGILSNETFNCYISTNLSGLVAPENLVLINKISDFLSEAITPALQDAQTYYVQVNYADSVGGNVQSMSYTGKHYNIEQVSTTIINITNQLNHIVFDTPLLQHSFNHGSIFLNGYIFGTARNDWHVAGGGYYSQCIFKVKADDYSDVTQKTFYKNSTAPHINDIIGGIDQIVYCRDFLWAIGFNYGSNYLLRIDPSNLDHVIFTTFEADKNQPISTDGNYLFAPTNTSILKYNVDLLLNTAAFYGYNGTAAVSLPENTVLGSCDIEQQHPTWTSYIHSAIIDSQNIYLAVTYCPAKITGYDSTLGQFTTFFQKINKTTMQTEGITLIPACTDDMVQNAEYVFLAPEIGNTTDIFDGVDWGLIAINKTTLEKKYLKALHKDFDTINESDRAGYGVFYFNDKITIQLISSNKTIVIDTSNVEAWGADFPIGGATESIFKYQINGIDLAAPCNELVIDNAGWVHTNTWEHNTILIKFNLSQLTAAEKTPNIQTTLIEATTDGGTVNGYIIDEGQSPITAGGFVYGTAPGNLSEIVPVTPFGSYDFDKLLTGLEPGIYYVAAYGTNTEGTFYGNTIILTIEAAAAYNSVTLKNSDTVALLRLLDGRNGFSVRCVQDAPGIATGTTGTAADIDGNVYQTVVINEKRWMIENLKTTKFRNGDAIPEITDATAWTNDLTGARCSYNNKPSLI